MLKHLQTSFDALAASMWQGYRSILGAVSCDRTGNPEPSHAGALMTS